VPAGWAGVEPAFVEHAGDPLAAVVSLNVKRRNLSKQQRAVIAAEAWDLVEPGSRDDPRHRKLATAFDVSHARQQRPEAWDLVPIMGPGEKRPAGLET